MAQNVVNTDDVSYQGKFTDLTRRSNFHRSGKSSNNTSKLRSANSNKCVFSIPTVGIGYK